MRRVRALVIVGLGLVASACSSVANDADAAGELGEHQCPVVAGGCQVDCHGVSALVYDLAAACVRDVPAFTCSRSLGGNGALGCFANDTSGLFAFVSGEAFYEPYFTDWRVCTEDERNMAFPSAACP